MRGCLEYVDAGLARGWVFHEEDPEDRLRILIKIDGEVVGSGIADEDRKDLKDNLVGDGRYGFRLPIGRWPNILDLVLSRRLVVEAASDKVSRVWEVDYSSFLIPELTERTEAAARSGGKRGSVEQAGPKNIFGWVMDEEDPADRMAVTVKIDGRVIGAGRADQFRRDLQRNAVGDGGYGFSVEIEETPTYLDLILDKRIVVEAASEKSGDVWQVEYSPHLVPELLQFSRIEPVFAAMENGDLASVRERISAALVVAPELSETLLNALNMSRVYFKDNIDSEFLRLAIDLAIVCDKPHTLQFYRELSEKLGKPEEGRIEYPLAPPDTHQLYTYATVKDIAELRLTANVTMERARYWGGRERSFRDYSDPSYLELCGILTTDSERSGKPEINILAFHVHAFGSASHWRVTVRGSEREAFRRIYELDFEQLRRLIDTGGMLIIDQSAEGPPADPTMLSAITHALHDLGIPGQQVVLVTQNLVFGRDAVKLGFPYRVAYANYNLKLGIDTINKDLNLSADGAISAHIEKIFSDRRHHESVKKYICLNFTPRPHRWAFVLFLSYYNYLSDGLVSFGPTNFKMRNQVDLAKMLPDIPEKAEYLAHVPELLAKCPLVVDLDPQSAPLPEFDYPVPLWARSLVNFVTESDLDDEHTYRVTEKVFKPMLGLQPFVVIGDAFSLRLLREMGFRTYGSIIDEGYDNITNPAERLNAIQMEVHRLLALDIETLTKQVEGIGEILVHNLLNLVRVAPVLLGEGVKRRLLSSILGSGMVI